MHNWAGVEKAYMQRQGHWSSGVQQPMHVTMLVWPHLLQQLDDRLDVIVCPLVMPLGQSALRMRTRTAWACMQ
jgi:hypothetical protein